jgi:hypothetical protein
VTIETEFLDLMPTTVTIFAKTATDAYGKFTFSPTGTAVRCRLQPSNDVVTTMDNREIVTRGTIIFYGTPTITNDSKIQLPDGTVPLIVSVMVRNDDTGAHHTTVTYA